MSDYEWHPSERFGKPFFERLNDRDQAITEVMLRVTAATNVSEVNMQSDIARQHIKGFLFGEMKARFQDAEYVALHEEADHA